MSNATLCAYYRQKRKKEKMTNAMKNRKYSTDKQYVYNLDIFLNRIFEYNMYLTRQHQTRFRRYNKVVLNNKNIYCGKIYYIKKRIPIQEYLGID